MNKLTVHIIGGTGKMGLWLKTFLENYEITVTTAGRDFLEKKSLISKADIVVISVPISETEQVIKKTIPLISEGSLLTDMTSVKTMPMSAMEEGKSAKLGMHPLFGPTVSSLSGQKIVFCRIKNHPHIEFLENIFRKAGIEVIYMSSEEHDYQLAYIQALTHATHLLYAKTILGQEKTIMTKLQTPTFAMHVLSMGRILSQDMELMMGIELYNPYFPPVFDSLMENAKKLMKILQAGDKKKFIEFFDEEQRKAKNLSNLSVFQTNKILRLISDMPPSIIENPEVKNIPNDASVAYLGPEGTYSHLATTKVFKKNKKIACDNLYEVFQKVIEKDVDFAIVPAENSKEGTVGSTMDFLAEFSLYVCGSFDIPIHHQLITKEKDLKSIKTIISHPQALAQCRHFFKEQLPHAKIMSTDSTAKDLKNPQKGVAYIGSSEAAKTYNVPILAKDIQDDTNNTTKFYVIAKQPFQITGIQNKKTLLFVTVYNRVGILRDILDVFMKENLNLTKLESRPSQEKLWDYHFFIEIEKPFRDEKLTRALKDLETYCPVIRILGQT